MALPVPAGHLLGASDAMIPKGGTRGSRGEQGMQILGEGGAVFLVIGKPSCAGLGS